MTQHTDRRHTTAQPNCFVADCLPNIPRCVQLGPDKSLVSPCGCQFAVKCWHIFLAKLSVMASLVGSLKGKLNDPYCACPITSGASRRASLVVSALMLPEVLGEEMPESNFPFKWVGCNRNGCTLVTLVLHQRIRHLKLAIWNSHKHS